MSGGPVRRMRAYAGQYLLLAVLALVAAALVTGTPRIANELADRGLRQDLAALPPAAAEVRLQRQVQPGDDPAVTRAAGRVDTYRDALPAPLPGLVEVGWHAAGIGPDGVAASADFMPFNGTDKPAVGLYTQVGAEQLVRLADGRWPRTAAGADRVEVAVATPVARIVGLPVGTALTLATGPGATTDVVVVGVFDPIDPDDPRWADVPLALQPYQPVQDGDSFRAVALTDTAGIAVAAGRIGPLEHTWRYQVDRDRLDAGGVAVVTAALIEARRVPPEPGLVFSSGLDQALSTFAGQVRAVQALLAVVQTGVLVTLVGLLVLAAGLAAERRRQEFALLRARGAAVRTVGARAAAESALLLPAAALLGWVAGRAAPGRPGSTDWLVVVVAVLATLALPLLAVLGQRRPAFVARRRDLASSRPSVRRLTGELLVLLVAALGAYLLNRRGLDPTDGVDLYLVSVPVLLATAAALLVLRALPAPLRLVGRLAARSRGAVPFLGLTRAGRGAPMSTGPLAVLVLAVSTGVFSGVVATTVATARDRAADLEIAGDARLDGFRFAADTAERVAELPGVTAVAAVTVLPGTALFTGSQTGATRLGQAQVVVVDAGELSRVLDRSGVPAELPAEFTAARPGSGPVPAVVSAEIADELAGRGATADVQGRFYDFAVGPVADRFPGLDVRARRFIVLPAQALPDLAQRPLTPNRILLAGAGFDPAAVRAAGDAGQRAHLAAVLGREVSGVPAAATVTTWSEQRQRMDRTGANEVLTFAFVAGTAGATVLALLAVGFAVLAGARSRGRVLSRLRTLGLSGGQGQAVLAYELAPLVLAAALAGGAVGLLLPALLAPTLGLDSFTAGMPAAVRLDPLVAAGVLGIVLLALTGALLLENVVNRRLRLGEVLRLGEESA